MPTLNTDLLTTKQAASYLNLHPSTLEKWRVYGGGPQAYRLGTKAIRYRRSDLDAFITGGDHAQ
jgi:excisionase family DNA binding protein